MSPRAACRLESLGFTDVHDYVAGKADWLARGLSTEGEAARPARAGEVARPAAVTCELTTPAAEVARRLREAGDDAALVLRDGVLMGLLGAAAAAEAGDAVAGTVMEPGPSTIRADVPLPKALRRLRRRGNDLQVVTDPDGRPIGVLRREA